MEDNKNIQKEKPTYEELNNIAVQLSNQNKELYNQLMQSNMSNTLARLEFLFKVVENANHFPSTFLNSCIEEIIKILTIPEQNSNKDE